MANAESYEIPKIWFERWSECGFQQCCSAEAHFLFKTYTARTLLQLAVRHVVKWWSSQTRTAQKNKQECRKPNTKKNKTPKKRSITARLETHRRWYAHYLSCETPSIVVLLKSVKIDHLELRNKSFSKKALEESVIAVICALRNTVRLYCFLKCGHVFLSLSCSLFALSEKEQTK